LRDVEIWVGHKRIVMVASGKRQFSKCRSVLLLIVVIGTMFGADFRAFAQKSGINVTKSTISLFLAVEKNDIGEVRLSLINGADVFATNRNGFTAAGLAQELGYFEISRLIYVAQAEQSTPNNPATLSQSKGPVVRRQIGKSKTLASPGSEQSPSPSTETISPVARSAGEGSEPVAQIEPTLEDTAALPAPAPKDEPGIFGQIFGGVLRIFGAARYKAGG